MDSIKTLHGVFAVYKPKGVTSADVVAKVKHSILASMLGPKQKPKDAAGHDAAPPKDGPVEGTAASGAVPTEPAASTREQMRRQTVKIPRHLEKAFKVGHGGTLDPLAKGVLVIGVGNGCKQLGDYLKGSKCYRAVATLGKHYDTQDETGVLQASAPYDHVTKESLLTAINMPGKFIGDAVMQKPPAFSAIRIGGVRAYDLARKRRNESEVQPKAKKADPEEEAKETSCGPEEPADALAKEGDTADASAAISPESAPESGINGSGSGKEMPASLVDIAARPVKISQIDLISFDSPSFTVDITCGGGTYVRSLLCDIAAEMNTYAALAQLERTKQGIFTCADCLTSEHWGDLDRISSAIKASMDALQA